MTPEPSKTTNTQGADHPWCIACGNTGYVHLAGGTGKWEAQVEAAHEAPRYSPWRRSLQVVRAWTRAATCTPSRTAVGGRR